MLMGLALRWWMVLQYPLLHGIQGPDEVVISQAAWGLVHSPNPWPLYDTVEVRVSLLQPIAAGFALFGTSMLSLRGPLAFESAALIPAFYLLARQFVNVPAALCSTALLALAYWPAILGLFAFGWMNGPLFQTLGLAFLVIGTKRGSLVAGALGGACLALCLYAWALDRILPFPALVFMGAYLITGARRLRRRMLITLSSAFGFAVVAAPWVSTILSRPSLLGVQYQDVQPNFSPGVLLPNTGRLIDTLLLFPDSNNHYMAAAVTSGGLLDLLTAALVVLGAIYALCSFWKPHSLLILSALLPVLILNASVPSYQLFAYRLHGAVPALFLAIAIVMNRPLTTLSRLRAGARWVLLASLLPVGWSGLTNTRVAAAHFSDCAAMATDLNLLAADPQQGAMIADITNQVPSNQAVFLVASYFQEWLWPWLYHVPPPREYNPSSGHPLDPASWTVMYDPLPTSHTGGARFWPPRLGPGQTGITYIMPDVDAPRFVPIMRRAYARGTLQAHRLPVCPSYTVTTYTLSAADLRTP